LKNAKLLENRTREHKYFFVCDIHERKHSLMVRVKQAKTRDMGLASPYALLVTCHLSRDRL
jgi:hypothetical protein